MRILKIVYIALVYGHPSLLLHRSEVFSFDVIRGLFVTFALLVLVRLHMFGQMVAPHEPLAAVRTHEAFFPGMSSQVPL